MEVIVIELGFYDHVTTGTQGERLQSWDKLSWEKKVPKLLVVTI